MQALTTTFRLAGVDTERARSFPEEDLFEVPGYEAAQLVGVGMHIGVRESRRIRGEYRLTADDVLAARRFDDAIAACGAPTEDHSGSTGTGWRYVPGSGTYDVPYRVLLPVGLSNVVVAGRCLSATHEAHVSCRSIAQGLATGQAAGTAAAQALSASSPSSAVALRDVDVPTLQQRLVADGAVLENPAVLVSAPGPTT